MLRRGSLAEHSWESKGPILCEGRSIPTQHKEQTVWHDFKKFIPKAAGKYNFTKTLESIKVCQEFRSLAPRILPKEALENTYPKTYKDRTLVIAALNSAWAQEINMKQHIIKDELNKKFGEGTIQKMRVEIAEDLPSAAPQE